MTSQTNNNIGSFASMETETITVLVVDDDPTILDSVSDLLRISGYRILSATNGIEGLHIMQSNTPDLIIADIMMPEMDGYQFYEAVRENSAWTPIPFIFLTARGEQKDIRRGYMLGADQYLTKPFEAEDLLVAVEKRLERIRAIQAVTKDEVEQVKQQLLRELRRMAINRIRMVNTGSHRINQAVVAVSMLADDANLLAYALDDPRMGARPTLRYSILPDGSRWSVIVDMRRFTDPTYRDYWQP